MSVKRFTVDELALIEAGKDEDMFLLNLAQGLEGIDRSGAHREIRVARRRAGRKELLFHGLHVLEVQPSRTSVLGEKIKASL